MKDAGELRSLLQGYTGCEQPYRHSLVRNFFYTDGVRAFAQNAGNGAYWLLDILATEPQIRDAVMDEGFCVVVLEVSNGIGTLIVARDTTMDGEGYEGIAYTRAAFNTDCPDGSWKFYLEPTQVGSIVGVMCMLPRER